MTNMYKSYKTFAVKLQHRSIQIMLCLINSYKQISQTRRSILVGLFTAVTEEIMKHADISEGIIIDRQHLTNLRFVDAAALFNEKTNQI